MKINRRTLLKALSGVPVVGLLGFSASRKWNVELENELQKANSNVVHQLGLGDFELPKIFHPASHKGDVVRIGVIGFGSRGQQLARSLGFVHQSAVDRMRDNGTLEEWLQQEDLNIAITGVCDVFDLHAETGIAIAQNEVRPGGNPIKLPVKRYRHYQEMLADKDIDAVIISTPDHHHARITVDAVKAGKHIYCEKAVALTEDELNEVYRAVKNSNIVYQLGHQNTKSMAFQQAREIMDKNILGKITLVETTSNRNSANGAWIRHMNGNNPKPGDESTIDWKQWLGDRPYQPFSGDRFYNWTKWFDYASGLISQLFTHEYDFVNQLMNIGIPKSAVSSGGLYFWKDNREMADLLNCVFEYPDRDLSLVYSASLASSRNRGRLFMGHDGSMDVGGSVSLTIDNNSTQYKEHLSQGLFKTRTVSLGAEAGRVDATTSATEMYYASRGLINTRFNGRNVDVTHLHLKEWLDCIRNGGEPSAGIEKSYEEGITCIMAHKAYVEKRRVEWDPINRKIV
jgi:predicted dehydrogenase